MDMMKRDTNNDNQPAKAKIQTQTTNQPSMYGMSMSTTYGDKQTRFILYLSDGTVNGYDINHTM